MFEPTGRYLLLQPCKFPFEFNKLDVFAAGNTSQGRFAWGLVLKAGPDAKRKVGDFVFYDPSTCIPCAMDHRHIRSIIDDAHVIGTGDPAKAQPIDIVARSSQEMRDMGIEVPQAGIQIPRNE